ncbi:MAG: glycerophosphodiester phosphodiesterase [Brevibacterium sp.]|uniref:glycerophosphodiester phosphodiesterase n=1 Tax=Brevibacterium sp. TaxID=1701 RepID=UPI003F8D9BB4
MSLLLSSVFNVAAPEPQTGAVDTIAYPNISAHRGGKTIYPENTLTAFKQVAANHPGQMLEFDVRYLKDGTAVVIHNATIDATATTTGTVADMTLAQWKKVRIKDPAGGTAPTSTLQEVLDEFAGTGVVMEPELKDHDQADRFIEQLWPYRHDLIVQSTNLDNLKRFVKSGFHTLQVTSVPETVDIIPGIYALAVRHTVLTPAIVDMIHDKGLPVWAWTPNTQAAVDDLLNMGVDSVCTDDPRLSVEREPNG